MVLHIFRAFFVLLMAAVAWSFISDPRAYSSTTWVSVAALISLSVVLVCIDILAPRRKLAVFSGVFLGMGAGIAIAFALSFITPLAIDQIEYLRDKQFDPAFRAISIRYADTCLGIVACYISISFIFQTKDDFRFIIPYVEFNKQTKGVRQLLIDTSVLIDGRIVDIAKTGIIESQIVIPRFVLGELQHIADEGDNLRRNRGRRGLDSIAALKSCEKIDVLDYDPPGRISGNVAVDDQLRQLAKQLNARILTNDLNLNKVAQLSGIDVVNLNDLANAMKAIVLPGETMSVRIIKAGEEAGQGIGFLPDGTMVVVEQARNAINQEIEFTVTNMVQRSAGRMIFGRMGETSDPPVSRRPRSRSETRSPT